MPATVALHERAVADLRYIRETMSRASAFTALSGAGFVLVGLGALATGAIAARLPDPAQRLAAWLADAALSVLVGAACTAWKARRAREPLVAGPLRKFVLAFVPPMLAGAAMTLVLARSGHFEALSALWLLCYGAGLAAAGASSVRAVPAMGWSFLGLGALGALVPAWAEVLRLIGFGGLHLGFGVVIYRRYGG